MKLLMHLLFFFILLNTVISEAQVPVLMRVLSTEQQDTTGCNFVKELAAVTYNEIMNGHAKLWDGPAHELQIFPQSLNSIEKSSGVSMNNCETVFIYEFWSGEKTLKSITQGFMFTGKDANGQDIGFGYVDFKDIEQPFLVARIKVNANGNYNANIAAYINNKNYNYRIIQFGSKVISSISESSDILNAFTKGRKWNPSAFAASEIPQKLVKWTATSDTLTGSAKNSATLLLLGSVDSFLHANEEVVYNNGGDHIIQGTPALKWRVTRIDASELWKKIDGKILSDLSGMTIYVNDIPMNEIPYREIARFEIAVNNQPLNEFLQAKTFYYAIFSINDQVIQRSSSLAYQKALLGFDWNKLSDYVRYY